jgi:sugar phosphate isomerase/epimerase
MGEMAIRISMGTWSFTFGPYAANPKPLEQVLRRLAEAGYDGVELNGYPPHVTLERYALPAARAGLRSLIDGLGLGVSGYSADLSEYNPAVEENRQGYLDRFRRLVELCHDLGSPMIRVDTGTAPGSLSDREYHAAFHHVADLWRECAEYAREARVLMAWEFEPGFVFNKPSEVLAMYERVGHAWFRILFDTAHAYMSAVVGARQHGPRETLEGGVAEFIGRLGSAIGAVHVIDSDGTLYGDDTSHHVPIGQGRVPWRYVAPALGALPRIEWWCADLCFYPGAWEMVEDNLRAARAVAAMARPPKPNGPAGGD